ncbi:oligoribonuclease [Actinomarinicola tropica]|uniref:Oligoribonuclease n=1 Tax=Actinomarinicola tropica TaxID=2789776 RepID=A0A5Q2RIA4_9ACTN|nr:oligoribonuclease [Actinomarinicola tropica]QGG93727.1 oligoribonuclease [Actinomarinicola tropica]
MLAWMDLEMTGLDPSRHVIVEIATLLTDDDLEIIAEGPDLVVHATEAELAEMDDFVRNMHTRSGLLPQITASTTSLEEAGRQTLEFLKAHIAEPRSVPLCGNSIGTDRRFLAVHLPEIEEFLHYRSVDVSTIKELGRRWNPSKVKGSPEKNTTHRALDDIRESIAELRYYREHLFVAAETVPVNVGDEGGADAVPE